MYNTIDELLSSNEHIAYMLDDTEFKEKLERIVTDLRLEFKLHPKIKPTDGAVIALFNELREVVLYRLGIPLYFIHGETLGYTLPITPGLNSVLFPDMGKQVKYIENMVKGVKDLKPINYKDLKSDKDLAAKTFTGMMKANQQVYKTMYESQKEIRELLGRIEIDLKNVRIKGLDSDNPKHNGLIVIGLHIHEQKKMTIEESVAILLHEISHTFTTLAYVSTQTNTFLPTQQSFFDNKNIEDKYKLINQITGHAIKAKTNTEAIAAMTKIIKLTPSELNDVMSGFNSEILADQFATRFGYGADLAYVFANHTHNNRSSIPQKELDALTIQYLLILVSAAYTVVIPNPITLMLLIYQISVFITMAIMLVITYTGKFTNSKGRPHEEAFSRVRRIKLELLRAVRTADVPSSTKKKLIGDLDEVSKLLSTLEKDRTTLQLVTNWLLGGSQPEGLVELTNRAEQLQENDLHGVLEKLKQG